MIELILYFLLASRRGYSPLHVGVTCTVLDHFLALKDRTFNAYTRPKIESQLGGYPDHEDVIESARSGRSSSSSQYTSSSDMQSTLTPTTVLLLQQNNTDDESASHLLDNLSIPDKPEVLSTYLQQVCPRGTLSTVDREPDFSLTAGMCYCIIIIIVYTPPFHNITHSCFHSLNYSR